MIKVKNLNQFENGKPKETIIDPVKIMQDFANSVKFNPNDNYLTDLAREYKRTTGRYLFKDTRKR